MTDEERYRPLLDRLMRVEGVEPTDSMDDTFLLVSTGLGILTGLALKELGQRWGEPAQQYELFGRIIHEIVDNAPQFGNPVPKEPKLTVVK